MPTTSYLSDNQRRILCRLVFLLVCALPTSILVYLLFHQPGPDDWERLVQAQLGIQIEIGAVETPRPNQVVLRAVRIAESVPGIPLEAEQLTIEEITIEQTRQGGRISVLHPVQISADVMSEIVQRCSQHVQRLNLGSRPWQIDFSKILLTDSGSETADLVLQPAGLTIETVTGSAESPESVVQIQLLTKLAADPPENLLRVLYQKTAVREYLNIETNGTIPCRLFQHWQPDLKWLGPSSFRGNVQLWINDQDEIDGIIAGDLTDIALDQLAQAYQLPLRGGCNLSGVDCRITDNQIESAKFHVASNRQGMIGRSFLEAAGRFGIHCEIDPAATALAYHQLGFHVAIDRGFLILSSENSMLAANASGEPLVTCPNEGPVPVHYLAVLLTGEKTIGSQSVALMNRFKIPAERMANSEMDPRQRF